MKQYTVTYTWFVGVLAVLHLPICASSDIMQAHLSGWYPKNEQTLQNALIKYDQKAQQLYPACADTVRAMIVPHAGLAYSGTLAAGCFRLLNPDKVKRVIVLAPSHTTFFEGILIPYFSAYQLPHGILKVHKKTVLYLKNKTPFVTTKKIKNNIFLTEHSLEMELLFIAHYLPQVTIVPLIVGCVSTQQIVDAASALKACVDDQTVVVVSSDFTHYGQQYNYMPFGQAQDALADIQQLDQHLIKSITAQDPTDFLRTVKKQESTICAKNSIMLLLELLHSHTFPGVAAQVVGYATSLEKKDADSRSCVSYCGIVFDQKIDN